MAYWLFKSEPEEYSYDQLLHDKKTWWTGVTNALARKHLRSVAKGDKVLLYHTGKEKQIVGEMVVSRGPTEDPEAGDEKSVMVEVKPHRRLNVPVTLETIKADPIFANWELVRIGRLSVMPVSEELWGKIQELGAGK